MTAIESLQKATYRSGQGLLSQVAGPGKLDLIIEMDSRIAYKDCNS